MWLVCLFIFIVLFIITSMGYLIFTKINNYVKIQDIKNQKEIERIRKEEE